jgi:peptidoglycan hydrolase CwlO-like protein
MLKKTLIGVGTAAALGSLIFGRDVVSYARTAWSATREAVKREVPLEFQVQRARTAVGQLVPAIQKTLKTIAEQQVDIEHLNKEIARRGEDLARQKDQVLTLKKDLESGRGTFRYASHTYTADEVKRDLKRRFDRFQSAESLLERDRRILVSREQALFAHEKQLDEMLSQKKELEAQVEQLEARLQTIRAEQVVSSPAIDESALAEVKRLIAEVNKQLDVQEKLLDADGRFVGLIPVESKPTIDVGDLTAEIDQYFNPTARSNGAKPAEAPKPAAAVAKSEGSKS